MFLNAYALDFYKHGSAKDIMRDNGYELSYTFFYEYLDFYLAHAYNACGEGSVFTVSVLPYVHKVGRGGGGLLACALFGSVLENNQKFYICQVSH